jgi:predicted membrane protein
MKVHLYIGLNAMRAAKGRKYKGGYFVAAIIVTVLSVLSLFTYIEGFQNIEKIDTTIASMLVDITTIYIFLVVIISSLRIKKIKGES